MITVKTLTPEIIGMALHPGCKVDRWEKLKAILLLRMNKQNTLDDVAATYDFSRERARQFQVIGIRAIIKVLGTDDVTLLKTADVASLYKLGDDYAVYDKRVNYLEKFDSEKSAVESYDALVPIVESALK